MPIYEYQCTNCGHALEALQKIGAEPLSQCPVCNNPALRKLVSASSFRLKGGGWYETDFKASGRKNIAGGAETATTDGGGASTASAASSNGQEQSSSSADRSTKDAASGKKPVIAGSQTGSGIANPG